MSTPLGRVGLEVPIVAQLFSGGPRSVSKTTAKALISHRRSRRSGVLTCIAASPMPNRRSFASRKPPSISQRLAYRLIKARAGWSAVLAARHHGSFMPVARTQTTVAIGYASAVTAAPRSVRARPPAPTQSAAARASPLVADHDVAAKADDEVELQFPGQHPIELVVAEAAIGHDAHTDIGGQNFRQAHQDLILVTVAPVFQRRLIHGQPNQWRGPSWWVNSNSMIVA